MITSDSRTIANSIVRAYTTVPSPALSLMLVQAGASFAKNSEHTRTARYITLGLFIGALGNLRGAGALTPMPVIFIGSSFLRLLGSVNLR